MKLLVTGAAGYLGSEVAERAAGLGWEVVSTWLHAPPAAGRAVRLDIRDGAAVARCLAAERPQAVIHTAYRQDVAAVRDAVVLGTRNVVVGAVEAAARLVHLSSDLVFDGEHGAPYTEADDPRPVSRYGGAKVEAEQLVAELDPAAVVVRTSLLYGKVQPGPQERLAAREDVAFYSDEIRCPTLVGELADALLELASRPDVAGVLHVAGADAVSRYDFARLLAPPGVHVRGAASPGAGRPRNVALDSSRATAILGLRLRGVGEVLHPL